MPASFQNRQLAGGSQVPSSSTWPVLGLVHQRLRLPARSPHSPILPLTRLLSLALTPSFLSLSLLL